MPESDAGGHPRAGLTADASSSPLQWPPRSMREHPNLCAGGRVVPELIEGSAAAASVWGERQRQSQPPKQEDAELPIVDDEVLAARDGGDRAAGTFAAFGQQQRPG